ncbi:MAG: 1-deoxy-D-xylulose-5-phosphate synthase [Bacteroidales bacterium]|jgi:1-deoxy-D-xylulose-5-phosphate synthase|nr:1-deoxy-D-xylulose-5-phosphate synthase [Bacteroidales bacterium]
MSQLYPSYLRKLQPHELQSVCDEVRQYIIDQVSEHPGHLGASLGVVELTVALHYVFNTPYDKIIWDVGHQAYAHKILTGRKEKFPSHRTYGGISGFPVMAESEYDSFGGGHASTSISAALGMAVASSLKGEKDRKHIAIIGDGSMTGGLAFEGLNNAGAAGTDILVVLNDNGISIDESTGALNQYLTKICVSNRYNYFKNRVWDITGGKKSEDTAIRNFLSKVSRTTKSFFFRQGKLFEALNFRYFGPIDGHDTETLVSVLRSLSEIKGPKLLHIITTKGKGLSSAEANPVIYHAPGKFDPETGERITTVAGTPRYQDVFGQTIIELAKNDERIVGITPAMPTSCSLNMMMKVMPERVFDVGIAEEHAVTFSAGLAAQGLVPFCNIYSSFLQRSFDQIIHDVAIQKLPVVFCIDRAGIVGEDGATHHGAFDLAYMRMIPDIVISSPMNERELRNLMFTAASYGKGPFAIRYPRSRGVMTDWRTPLEIQPVGKGIKVCGSDNATTAIVSIGHIGNMALNGVGNDPRVALYNMIYLKPIDEKLLGEIFSRHKRIITLEDGTLKGGLFSAVSEFAFLNSYKGEIIPLGIPDKFISHGTVEQLYSECGLTVENILNLLR